MIFHVPNLQYLVVRNIEEAAFLAEELETLCKQITIAKINGTAKLVGKKDMKKIIEAVKTYGKQ